jgi:hypothetical protein
MIGKLPLFAFALSAGTGLQAQTTLTSANVNAAPGQSSTVYICETIDEGPSGANQTWDLSELAAGPVQSRAYSGGNASYPASNITMTQTVNGSVTSGYMKYDNTGQQFIAINGGGTVFNYSDPMYQLKLPAAYNSSATDTYECSFTSNGTSFVRSGTLTQNVDGYGTLVTPEGTFANVMRVHLHLEYTDVTSFLTINYTTDVYTWYKPGVKDELASVNYLNSDIGSSTSASYLEATGLGLTEDEIGVLAVYPNPVTDQLKLSLSETGVQSVIVTDIQGNIHICELTQEGSVARLNSSDLSAGIYFIRMAYSSGKVEQAKVTIL